MRILLLFFSIILATYIYPQQLELQWQQCYGGNDWDDAFDIIALEGSGYFIVGFTYSNDGDISFNHGENDVWLVKIDNYGNLLWEKTYGGSGSDAGYSIVKSNDGTFYIMAGSTSSDGDISFDPYPGSCDFWVLKIDSIGNILWDKILGGTSYDNAYEAKATSDGGVILLGWTGSNDGDVSNYFGGWDIWVAKLNSEGELEWEKSFGTSGSDFGQAIIETSDGGYLVGGSPQIEDGGNIDCDPFNWSAEAVLLKLDSLGNIEWQKCYGGSTHEGIVGLLETDNGYVFTAYTESPDSTVTGWHGEDDIWFVKTDFNGNIIWEKCYGGSDDELAYNIFQTDENGLIIAGYTESNDGDVSGNQSHKGYKDIWMFKIDSTGILLWQQCIGGIAHEEIEFGIIQLSNDNFIIAGKAIYGPSLDVECSLSSGDNDFWIFELHDTTIGLIENTKNQNEINVSPNPFTTTTTLSYTLDKPENVQFTVYNVQSQIVFTIQEWQDKGQQRVQWNAEGLPAGMYYFRIQAGEMVGGGKMVRME